MIDLLRALQAHRREMNASHGCEGFAPLGGVQAAREAVEREVWVAPHVAELLAHLEAMQATERARLAYVAHPDELTLAAHEKAKWVEWAARDQLRAAVVMGVKL